MVWLFARQGRTLSVETQYDNVAREYILTLRDPAGVVTVERYATTALLEARLSRLEDALVAEDWRAGERHARMAASWHL